MAYRFQISANLLSWPSQCACCSGTPDTKIKASASRTTGKRVRNTTTCWWEVPYCNNCIRHKKAYESASTWLLIGFFLGIVVWYVSSGENSFLHGLYVFLASFIFYFLAKSKAKRLMTPNCSCHSSAVNYLSWHGTVHTFIFTNKNYMNSFLGANSQKKRSDINEV